MRTRATMYCRGGCVTSGIIASITDITATNTGIGNGTCKVNNCYSFNNYHLCVILGNILLQVQNKYLSKTIKLPETFVYKKHIKLSYFSLMESI